MEDHAGVLRGGDEGFVGIETMPHPLLKLIEGESPRCRGGHFETPGVDGAVFLFREGGDDSFGCPVERAVGFGQLCEKEIPDGGDDGGFDEADGAFVFEEEGVDELDGAVGVALFDGPGDFPDHALVAHRDHKGDVFHRHFPSFFSEVEVEFLDFVGDLAGFGPGTLYEERERLSFECQALVFGDAADFERNLFFPAFFRDVDLVVGSEVGVGLEPFSKSAHAVDGAAAEEEDDAGREAGLEGFEEVFGPGDGAFGFAGAVGAEEVGGLEPDDLVTPEEADGLKGFDGLGGFLKGVLGVVGHRFDDLVREFVGARGLEFFEKSGGFLSHPTFIRPGHDVN